MRLGEKREDPSEEVLELVVIKNEAVKYMESARNAAVEHRGPHEPGIELQGGDNDNSEAQSDV